ncbi:MAG: DUF1573 domain-containing protein [Candidatus Omnitrophota bacterium]|jgi:hypothetical protein
MRKIILPIFFFFLFTAFCRADGKANDPNLWDFGTVKAGEVLKHEFSLKNDSAKTLNINNVSTSCGCTASLAKKKSLLPGESTTIEVKFNSKGYSGEVKQHIYVNTDNVDKALIVFIIRANVVK